MVCSLFAICSFTKKRWPGLALAAGLNLAVAGICLGGDAAPNNEPNR
jgi:hypothetical protein